MSITRVPGGPHVCPLPQSTYPGTYASGETVRCDGCGRFWRYWDISSTRFEWTRVGRWESRKLRRQADAKDVEEQP